MKEQRTIPLSFRTTKVLYGFIQQECAKNFKKFSEYINELIVKDYYDKQNNNNKIK